MVRSNSIRIWLALLAATIGQQSRLIASSGIPANAVGRTIVVTEGGKSAKCTVLKVWQTADGAGAMLVEAIDTGERISIIQAGQIDGSGKALSARIYHWGRGHTKPPAGVPFPPGEEIKTTPAAESATRTVEKKKTVVLPGAKTASLPVIVDTPAAPLSQAQEPSQITGNAGPTSAVCSPSGNNALPEIKNHRDTKTSSKGPQLTSHSPPVYSGSPYARPVWTQSGAANTDAGGPLITAAPAQSPARTATTTMPAISLPQPAPAVSPLPVTMKKETVPDQPADWRESWGKLKDSTPAPSGKAEKKTIKTTQVAVQPMKVNSGLEKVDKADPLMDPEAYSKVPVSEKVVQKIEVMKADNEKVRAALQPKTTILPEAVAPVRAPVSTSASLDLPPDDFHPDAESASVVKPAYMPPVREKTPSPVMAQSDLPPQVIRQKTAPVSTAEAPILVATGEHTVHKIIMPPPGLNSMLYTAPMKEDPSVAPLPFSDKDKIKQWMAVLKESIYPSQREWAAEQLSACDWHKSLEVVPELLKAAKEDSAATVRAGCIRCLARMNVNTVPTVLAIQAMKKDADPRVQTEAEQALSILAPDLPMKSEKSGPTVNEEGADAKDPVPPKEQPAPIEGDLPPSDGHD
ncbi:MAG: HEAT repeat domain-containing protein [Gemmataceae bacterium]